MPPKLRFTEGEKVLCFHGPLLYEAKCIKSQTKDKQVKYFIHYSGWNKNWDEWVPESRVLKHNEANLQKQKELQKAHVKTKKSKPSKVNPKKEKDTPGEKERVVTPTPEKPIKQEKVTPLPTPVESPTDAQRKKRTRAELNVETEDEYIQKIEVKVRIPDELKIWLIDDYDLVNKQRKLVHLPARATVESIVQEYEKVRYSEKGMNGNKHTAIEETCSGVREYFNIMLAKQLLYKFERPQHQDIVSQHPEKTMSQIYGAIHLLRLFARIGSLLAYTVLDDEAICLLINNFHDFQKFMCKPSQNFLSLSDYETASPEYLKKVVW